MIFSTTQMLQRKLNKLEKVVHNKNPNDFLIMQLLERDGKSVILELKIPITKN